METFACLQTKGSAAGVPIAGMQGQATARGITMRWDYDADAGVLVVECLAKPMLAPCALIARTVTELVDGCRAQAV